MIELIIVLGLVSPREIPAMTYEKPITETVSICPEGYQLMKWHQHIEIDTYVTVSPVGIFHEDPPSGYYPVLLEQETSKNEHPDKCVLKDGIGNNDGKRVPSQ